MIDFYYCSGEVDRPELPVRCQLVRYLAVDGKDKKAAVIRTEHRIHDVQKDEFVVLGKGADTIEQVFKGDIVGVFLMPLDQRAGPSALDLSAGLQPVQDWGTLTLTSAAAQHWQLRN
jgi:hypothetical protein